MVNQLSLNLWKDEYSFEFLLLNNEDLVENILNYDGQILLTGPKFSGKKHLAFYLFKKYNIQFFISKLMSDTEILDYYEKCNSKKNKCIWIVDFNNDFCKDVKSRFNSLILFSINDLDEINFVKLLRNRLNRVGICLNNDLFDYCIRHLSCSYLDIDVFIKYITTLSIVNLKNLHIFFTKI